MTLNLTFEPLSDVGRERSENQDAFGSQHLDGLDFYIVCDGMGGHRGGSTASRLGVATIEAKLAEHDDLPPEERMAVALTAANDVIYAKAQKDRDLHGMGTTAVLLAIDSRSGTAHYAHVGDSRLYLVRGDTVRQLTRDHTFVQRLVDDGILTPEAADGHPQANVIIRSLGGQPDVDVEVGDTPLDILEGDLFLLCSDGLHGLVSEPEIASLAFETPLDQAVVALIDKANERGGHDNITVELVLVGQRAAPIPAEWKIERPTPAPGTRLAKKAAVEAEEAEAAEREEEVQRTPAKSEAPTEIRPYTPPDTPPKGLGTFVLVTVVIAILLSAWVLFGVLRGSPSASSTSAPEGTLPARVIGSDASAGAGSGDGAGSGAELGR